MRSLLALILSCVLLSACSSTPEKIGTEKPASTSVATPQPVPQPVPVETESQRQARIIGLLAGKSIYFEYDNYSINPVYQDLLRQDYEFLKSAPKLLVTLEGNADERGSTEYNLALGQKRAESVRHALKLLGVLDVQMEAISYGKEKPRTTCSEEKCWAENRRVDLVFRKADATK